MGDPTPFHTDDARTMIGRVFLAGAGRTPGSWRLHVEFLSAACMLIFLVASPVVEQHALSTSRMRGHGSKSGSKARVRLTNTKTL